MNFLEAVKAMKEGKKVRRNYYPFGKDGYMYIEDMTIRLSHNTFSDSKYPNFQIEDFESIDWKIYENSRKANKLWKEHLKRIK